MKYFRFGQKQSRQLLKMSRPSFLIAGAILSSHSKSLVDRSYAVVRICFHPMPHERERCLVDIFEQPLKSEAGSSIVSEGWQSVELNPNLPFRSVDTTTRSHRLGKINGSICLDVDGSLLKSPAKVGSIPFNICFRPQRLRCW